jgi:hypothetical protein
MRRFVLGWKTLGHQQRLHAYIVNYADDFVICCRPGFAEEAMQVMRAMMERLRLTVNEQKTHVRRLPEERFDFLGFTFGPQVSWRTGRRYLTPTPAKKKILRVCDSMSEETSRRTTWRDETEIVSRLNRILLGWGNYFRLGYVTGAWQIVQQHACRRLRWWIRRKHGQRVARRGPPDLRLYEEYGLVKLTAAIRRVPLWATAR